MGKKSVSAAGILFAGLLICSVCMAQQAKDTLSYGLSKATSELFLIAQEKGFFEEQGLNLITKEYPSGKRSYDGMINDEVDIGIISPDSLYEMLEGEDVRVLCITGIYYDFYQVIARKDRGIETPQDLKEKNIAVQPQSAMSFFLYNFLIDNEIYQNEVSITDMPVDELKDALAAGRIDAFAARDPFISNAKNALKDNAIIFSQPDQPSLIVILTAKNKTIQEKPQAFKKFMKAMVQADNYLHANKNDAADILSKAMNKPKQDIIKRLETAELSLSLSQFLVLKMEDFSRWAMEHGYTSAKEMPNVLDYIYLDALESADPQRIDIMR